MKVVVPVMTAVALVWYINVVTHQNIRIGGTQLLTPLNAVLLLLVIGLLALYDHIREMYLTTFWVDEEGKITRERLREYLHDQDCADVSEVEHYIPPVYQDLQDYAKNHRQKKASEEDYNPPPLPVLDPQQLRWLEDQSEREHSVLCGSPNPDYADGELELFGNPIYEKARRKAVRRKRKVARKLKTCLYIRAWVRSVVPPESLRVETDEDGEMFIDKATNCLVDNKLREFFKLHCFNLQSIAEYQDLAKVVVFYTNEELGIAELLEPRLGKPLPR